MPHAKANGKTKKTRRVPAAQQTEDPTVRRRAGKRLALMERCAMIMTSYCDQL